jgi:hypothetical protein
MMARFHALFVRTETSKKMSKRSGWRRSDEMRASSARLPPTAALIYFAGCQPAAIQRSRMAGAVTATMKSRACAGSLLLAGTAAE